MTTDTDYRKQLERRISRKRAAIADLEWEVSNLESSIGELQGDVECLEEELQEIIEDEKQAKEIPWPNPPYGWPLNQPVPVQSVPCGAPLTEARRKAEWATYDLGEAGR